MRVEKNHIFFDDLLNAKIAVKKASKMFETCKHEDSLVYLFQKTLPNGRIWRRQKYHEE